MMLSIEELTKEMTKLIKEGLYDKVESKKEKEERRKNAQKLKDWIGKE